MFDAVLAADLTHHQLRIGEHLDPLRAAIQRVLQGVDQRLVLGDVVGGAAQVAVERRDLRALGIRDEDAEARLSGISPAGAVDVDVEGVAQGSGTVTGTGGS